MAHPLIRDLERLANKDKAAFFPRFFKTGPGQYGEGDRFLGVTVPQVREVVKRYAQSLDFAHIEGLLENPIHEVRLAGVLALVFHFEHGEPEEQKRVMEFYLAHFAGVNNWDLVDASAAKILGAWLWKQKRSAPLKKLARSTDLWTQRLAIVATYAFIRDRIFEPTLQVAFILLHHPHDLIQKAVGWMLREVGKRDERVLREFLDEHAAVMPRTMLRYAIERFPVADRSRYLALGRPRTKTGISR